MRATPLSLTARTLYAELRELALAMGATEHLGKTPGSLVRKVLKGKTYLYHQYRDLDGRTRQAYLGPDNIPARTLAARVTRNASARADDLRRLGELRAAFVAAGGGVIDHAPMRVLRGFAEAGVLRPGHGQAVLVGTHAFNVLGNLLGVHWALQSGTHDIDVASDTDVDLAVGDPMPSAPDVLARLEMGFVPVPTLDPHSPSTSFRVRGQELRVDLVAPLIGKRCSVPVHVPALNAFAQPLRFLDYLLVDPVPAVAVGRRDLVLLNVPAAERFALHKLLVSESRTAVFATKAAKDREQAMQVLEVLIEFAPDGLAAAKADLMARGSGWTAKLARALKKAARDYPDATAAIRA